MQYTAYNLPIVPPPKNLCKATACTACSMFTAMIFMMLGFFFCTNSCGISSEFPFSCTKNGQDYCCGSTTYGPYSCGNFNNCNIDDNNCTVFWVGTGIFCGIFTFSLCWSIALRMEHQRLIN